MKSKKKQHTLNWILIGLATASVGMFAYSNVYLPKASSEDKVTVYVAKEDIPAKVDLKDGMFKPVKVSKDSYIEGSVTDLKQIKGKQLTGKLEAGELLSVQRISEEVHSDGPLVAELSVNTAIPLKNNDKIRIYVQYVDEDGKLVVEELFHEKRIVSKESLENNASFGQKIEEVANEATRTSNDVNSIFVRLTDKEVVAYQEAVNTGTLYLVKILDEEDQDTLSSGQKVSDRKVKTESTETDDSSGTVALYQVQEGDTLSTIAQRFMTTEDRIVALNDGKTEFKVGDTIQVPGN